MVLWNYDSIWKKYSIKKPSKFRQKYGTIPRTMALRFTKIKHGILSKTKKISFVMEKNYGYIPKQLKFFLTNL